MRLSKSCYAVTGLAFEPPWSVNAGFVAGEKRTLIIDSGANSLAARTILGYAQAVKPDNELLVINTERHLDHIGGNYFFRRQGLPVWGHAGIARCEEDLEESIVDYNRCIPDPVRREAAEGRVFYRDTHVANPDHPIEAEFSFDLGGLEARVIFTPGHTPTNLSVFVPPEGVIYCGDCVVSDYIPNLEAGALDDWLLWEQSLAKLEKLNPGTIMPGHGEVLQGQRIGEEFSRLRHFLAEAGESGCPPTRLAEWLPEKARLLGRVKDLPPRPAKLKDSESPLEIQLMEPGEVDLIREIMFKAFGEYKGKLAVPASGESEDPARTRQALAEGGAIIARLEGQPVGAARFQLKPGFLYIERVSVLPGFKRKGVGSAMLDYMDTVARYLERPTLRLGTRGSMPRNVELYQRHGYKIVSTWPHPKGDDTIILMLKTL
jgi:glyoxylase-like metal-dependent hydrolase (beta-lactamase superfamily II)/ribosomal protein S18 acetylase RimI-like enzyme